jgi:hypothetical protein
VPVEFTEDDFRQVVDRNYIVKVIYLPDPQFQDGAGAGPDEIVSTRLEPGQDPIQEALRRGSILLVLRIGNIDQGLQHSPPMTAPGPGGPMPFVKPPHMGVPPNVQIPFPTPGITPGGIGEAPHALPPFPGGNPPTLGLPPAALNPELPDARKLEPLPPPKKDEPKQVEPAPKKVEPVLEPKNVNVPILPVPPGVKIEPAPKAEVPILPVPPGVKIEPAPKVEIPTLPAPPGVKIEPAPKVEIPTLPAPPGVKIEAAPKVDIAPPPVPPGLKVEPAPKIEIPALPPPPGVVVPGTEKPAPTGLNTQPATKTPVVPTSSSKEVAPAAQPPAPQLPLPALDSSDPTLPAIPSIPMIPMQPSGGRK